MTKEPWLRFLSFGGVATSEITIFIDFLNNQIFVYVYFQTCWCCVWCWVWAWGAVMIDVRMVGRWFSLKSALKPRNLMQFGQWTVEGSTYRQSERKTRLCSINGVTPTCWEQTTSNRLPLAYRKTGGVWKTNCLIERVEQLLWSVPLDVLLEEARGLTHGISVICRWQMAFMCA